MNAAARPSEAWAENFLRPVRRLAGDQTRGDKHLEVPVQEGVHEGNAVRPFWRDECGDQDARVDDDFGSRGAAALAGARAAPRWRSALLPLR